MLTKPHLVRAQPRHGDEEVGELKVSLGVVSGRIIIQRSAWQRVRRFLRRTPFEEQVAIVSGNGQITVYRNDHATIDCSILLVNYSRAALQIEQLQVEWIGVGNNSVSAGPPQSPLIPPPIAALAHAYLPYRMELGPAGVRELRERIQPAPNARSSPWAHLQLRGAFLASQGGTRSMLRFDLNVPNCAAHFYNDTANETA